MQGACVQLIVAEMWAVSKGNTPLASVLSFLPSFLNRSSVPLGESPLSSSVPGAWGRMTPVCISLSQPQITRLSNNTVHPCGHRDWFRDEHLPYHGPLRLVLGYLLELWRRKRRAPFYEWEIGCEPGVAEATSLRGPGRRRAANPKCNWDQPALNASLSVSRGQEFFLFV